MEKRRKERALKEAREKAVKVLYARRKAARQRAASDLDYRRYVA